MEVNAVVALMRSHQFDQAQQLLKKCNAQNHPSVMGLKIFFLLRDKKYSDAMQMVENREDAFSVLLKVHILMQQKQTAQAIDTLVADLMKWPGQDIPDGLLQMLIKSTLNLSQVEQLSELLKKAEFSAQVYFAYIEVLMQFKQNSKIPEYVELLYQREPENKQV